MIYEIDIGFDRLCSTDPTSLDADRLWNVYSLPEDPTKLNFINWTRLGFQREDSPLTDFRSTYLLGLHQLEYLCIFLLTINRFFASNNLVEAQKICIEAIGDDLEGFK